MDVSLLDKTRKINRLLQKSENIEYEGVAKVLSDVLGANVYITNKKGELSGHAFLDNFECDLMLDRVVGKKAFPHAYATWLLKHGETQVNLKSKSGKCAYDDSAKCMFTKKNTTIVPIYGVGERIGTLIVAKYDNTFDDDDILLAEYGATVVGMEMLRESSKNIEENVRKKATVQVALATLSYSEIDAATNILLELDGKDGRLVASTIADKIKITRSVIVNALRKLESAGLIKSQSLGMKGTHIEILNEYLLDEIQKLNTHSAHSVA